ncbi:hypothetical protein K438DRAFT_1769776 [Mycena galopus ATCC 62051]|nr:hypothetical protein K438DRAFT_1769776 [Mycena galopus ATCC 62051]
MDLPNLNAADISCSWMLVILSTCAHGQNSTSDQLVLPVYCSLRRKKSASTSRHFEEDNSMEAMRKTVQSGENSYKEMSSCEPVARDGKHMKDVDNRRTQARRQQVGAGGTGFEGRVCVAAAAGKSEFEDGGGPATGFLAVEVDFVLKKNQLEIVMTRMYKVGQSRCLSREARHQELSRERGGNREWCSSSSCIAAEDEPFRGRTSPPVAQECFDLREREVQKRGQKVQKASRYREVLAAVTRHPEEMV